MESSGGQEIQENSPAGLTEESYRKATRQARQKKEEDGHEYLYHLIQQRTSPADQSAENGSSDDYDGARE